MPADIILHDDQVEVVENLTLARSAGRAATIELDTQNGNIVLGGDGRDGDVVVKNRTGEATIILSGESANANFGGHGQDGDIILKTADGAPSVHLNGSGGNLHLGARNNDGDLFIYDRSGDDALRLDGQTATLRVGHRGNGGNLRVLSDTGVHVVTADGTGLVTCSSLEADTIVLGGIGDLASKIADLESGTPSDATLKAAVEPLEDTTSLVAALVPVTYRWQSDANHQEPPRRVGFVAQDVQAVLPEAVTEDSSGTLRIDVAALVAVLTETVNRQNDRIDDLSSALASIQDRVDQLEHGP